jgi:hypothetical protein
MGIEKPELSTLDTWLDLCASYSGYISIGLQQEMNLVRNETETTNRIFNELLNRQTLLMGK